jgi:hypothetical protein
LLYSRYSPAYIYVKLVLNKQPVVIVVKAYVVKTYSASNHEYEGKVPMTTRVRKPFLLLLDLASVPLAYDMD